MNTAPIRAYAPKARKEFYKAVTERAAQFGIHGDDRIDPVSFTGDVAMIGSRAFSKKGGMLREKLAARVRQKGYKPVMRAGADTWFNRFVAIRYMELHDFLGHGYRVLSNPGVSDIPEILEHATDVDLPDLDRKQTAALRLAGDRDNDLYRMLVLAQCSALNKAMPFLFKPIDHETELLLPDNLLHTRSPVRQLVTDIDESLWQDVEIIGWIYQFYISEKKDQVIGKVVPSRDIPSATQLFTPNWIVKYMVENTLGRLWMAGHPASTLKDRMAYYIPPEEPAPAKAAGSGAAPEFLDPEQIRFFDPACGSGHILVEAYDLFRAIYLERGYRTRDIPRLILSKNLYGLDIDDRAAQLAGFALLMRARKDDRRILDRPDVTLNIQSIVTTRDLDMDGLVSAVAKLSGGKGVWNDIRKLTDLFHHADTFGSLITIPDDLATRLPDISSVLAGDPSGHDDLFSYGAEQETGVLVPVIRQAMILAGNYDCVVANPPYMGTKGMNPQLKEFLRVNFPDVKSDLFAAFIVRNCAFTEPEGYLGFMTPFVWMFISSYEKLRSYLIDEKTITSLIQLEYSGFDGATVPICTFTLANEQLSDFTGGYVRLSDFRGAAIQGEKALEIIQAARKAGK
jgi:hypothetical protein